LITRNMASFSATRSSRDGIRPRVPLSGTGKPGIVTGLTG
jgi:hypothetical protein